MATPTTAVRVAPCSSGCCNDLTVSPPALLEMTRHSVKKENGEGRGKGGYQNEFGDGR